jgi:hypothetical protein
MHEITEKGEGLGFRVCNRRSPEKVSTCISGLQTCLIVFRCKESGSIQLIFAVPLCSQVRAQGQPYAQIQTAHNQ